MRTPNGWRAIVSSFIVSSRETGARVPGRARLAAGLAEHAAAARAGAKASEALGHQLRTELELARRAARGVRAAPAGQNEYEPPSGRLV